MERIQEQAHAGHGFLHAVEVVADTLAAWSERVRQRRELEALPDHMLSDIGLSRADVEAEAAKPFWRA